jgi:hypothetical protein
MRILDGFLPLKYPVGREAWKIIYLQDMPGKQEAGHDRPASSWRAWTFAFGSYGYKSPMTLS